MRRVLAASAFVLLPIVACGDEESADEYTGKVRSLSSAEQDGIATFYDADGSGNCSFERSKDLDVVALNFEEYDRSASCGGCLEVSGPKGDVIVRVVDSCPPCSKNGVNLDLSASAFAKIADPKKGRIPVTYRLVSCAAAGNLAFHFKDGSSKYWTAIQVRNHKVPIAKLEFKKGGTWVPMKRETYNYFVAEKGVGEPSGGLQLRITATDGQRIEETLGTSIPSNKTVNGKSQFD